MKLRQKCIIATMIAMGILSMWLFFQELQSTAPEPEIIYMSPTLVMTAIPTPTETPNTTATPNMPAAETPTRRVTTGWHHGGGGASGRSTPAPIPELPTAGLLGAGLLCIVGAARAAKQPCTAGTCQCVNLDERWLCLDCGHCWFATLDETGCPNCGASIDRIDVRNDLAVDYQGRKI